MKKLTTQQIIDVVDSAKYFSQEWEETIESHIRLEGDDATNVRTAARFLEQWMPGEQWSAREFHNLCYAHMGSRWASAAEYGTIRAHEEHVGENFSDEQLAAATASDEAAVAYAATERGTHLFADDDGTVLAFHDLLHRDQLEGGA